MAIEYKDSTLTNNFSVLIPKADILSASIQAVTMPDISLGQMRTVSPDNEIPLPSNMIRFGQVTVEYMLEEDCSNFKEVYDWMQRLKSAPDKKALVEDLVTITIMMLSNKGNVLRTFDCLYCWPTNLSAFSLSAQDGESIITGSVTFELADVTVA